jgi:uncharacterized protein YukE
MGQAASLWAAAGEIDELVTRLRAAVPEHWRGPAARRYQLTAATLATGLVAHAERVRALAAQVHAHELEVTSVRIALATGAMVPV